MQTIILIGVFTVGFAAGMYVASQIGKWIDNNTK
tara:strand:+ start:318 stop:419 length:102 start_codon:yes stop_codon:yes gene_type:complete